MQEIALGTTGRTTTRLGFGCSSVMGVLTRKESLAMLESAVDAGITHFDVAPSYGMGQAENCLGELLARHPGKLTVTTKYGIPPAKNQSVIAIAKGIARPLIKRIPALKKRLAGVAGNVTRNDQKATFAAAEARASLERSLTELKTSHIDVWLLHEATAADLADDGLLRFLEDSVVNGSIGTFGVGSGAEKIPALLDNRPAFCSVLQYEWSVLDPTIPPGPAFRIHHRALTENFRSLHAALLADPATCRRWSEVTGQDLSQSEVLANLMLKASLVANPESIILFSSKSPAHVRANVALVGDTSLEDSARRLHQLVQAGREAILPMAVR
jgi:D-threo-aldose 1-dehydrogenase